MTLTTLPPLACTIKMCKWFVFKKWDSYLCNSWCCLPSVTSLAFTKLSYIKITSCNQLIISHSHQDFFGNVSLMLWYGVLSVTITLLSGKNSIFLNQFLNYIPIHFCVIISRLFDSNKRKPSFKTPCLFLIWSKIKCFRVLGNLRPILNPNRSACFDDFTVASHHTVEPVSYTHLDVYKRQWLTQ